MNFKDFRKQLKGIKYKSDKDWELFLPFNTKAETIQKIITVCRENLIVDWHIVFGEVTKQIPEPETRMYWDDAKKS